MPIPPQPNSLRSPRTGIPAVDLALGDFYASLKRLLRAPFLVGNSVKGIVLPGAASIAVAHGLGQIPQGYLITRVRNGAGTSSGGSSTGPVITAPDANTLLHWTCDEATGSTVLANTGTGGNADLTVQGTGYGPILDQGLFKNAAFLLRNTGAPTATVYFASGALAPVPPGNFTMSVWVKPKALHGAGYALASRPSGGTMNALGWGVNNSTDLTPQFFHNDPLGGSYYLQFFNVTNQPSTEHRLALDAWNFLAVTWNGTTLSLYCNADLVAQSTPPSAPFGGVSSTIWALGADPAGTVVSNMDAWIDDPRVESVARSAAYLQTQYQAGMFGGGGAPVVVNSGMSGLYDDPARKPDNRNWYFVANSAATVDVWFF